MTGLTWQARACPRVCRQTFGDLLVSGGFLGSYRFPHIVCGLLLRTLLLTFALSGLFHTAHATENTLKRGIEKRDTGPMASTIIGAGIEVDAELVLAVDVSRSMSTAELEIQRRGYAEALSSSEVINAIKDGMLGRVAITYVEWAGQGAQRTIVDWTLVDGLDDAKMIAERLISNYEPSMRRTSISGALHFAANRFEDSGYVSNRRIIDISGDGPNNSGHPVKMVRDTVLARGITINGLPLMTSEGMGVRFNIANLDQYYRYCVIGGPGAFVLPVMEWGQFATAVRQKIVLELTGADPVKMQNDPTVPEHLRPIPLQSGDVDSPIVPVAFHQAPSQVDCMVGEKIWEQIMDVWDSP